MAGGRMQLTSTVLNAAEPERLAGFYRHLLGWETVVEEPGWVRIGPPDGGTGLAFQSEDAYVPPVWPATPGEQQMMMHLDIEVDDLDAAEQRARALGATVAPHQPQPDVRVVLDPAGHPFCFWVRT
ncbi:glyoxalase [Kitasatospora sp. NE20-6]|uniref:VOC family protein n=1 Tax=Kitasatospora sp. NE20-6 TaxID=2859066 RepID=UPI0034DBB021